MTRDEMIERIVEMYYQWSKPPEKYDYFEDMQRETKVRDSKYKELSNMTTEELTAEYVDTLIMKLYRKEI